MNILSNMIIMSDEPKEYLNIGREEYRKAFSEFGDKVYNVHEDTARLMSTLLKNLNDTMQSLLSKMNLMETRVNEIGSRFNRLIETLKSQGPIRLDSAITESVPDEREIGEPVEESIKDEIPDDIIDMNMAELKREQDDLLTQIEEYYAMENEKGVIASGLDETQEGYIEKVSEYAKQAQEIADERLRLEKRLISIEMRIGEMSTKTDRSYSQ